VNLAPQPIQDVLRLCTEHGDPEGWEELIRQTQRMLSSTIRRTCLRYGLVPDQLVDDLLQEVYLKISANHGALLQQFVAQEAEALYPYLKIVAVNQVTDYCRSKEAACRRASRTVSLQTEDTAIEAHAQTPAAIERNMLFDDIDRILEKQVRGPSAKRDRSVFWLYHRQGLTAKEIASIPGMDLSVKGVETLIHRLRHAVRAEMVAGLRPKNPEGKSQANTYFKEGDR